MRGMSDIPPQHTRALATGRELSGTAARDADVPNADPDPPHSPFSGSGAESRRSIRPLPRHPRHRRSDRAATSHPGPASRSQRLLDGDKMMR